MQRSLLVILALVLVSGSLTIRPGNTSAAPIAGEPFQRTWQRTDQPVANGQVSRTWMWGPEPFSDALQEPYEQSPGGQRMVQYFDKSRMEITEPGADQTSPWYVTNGLLVVELMSGRMQVGDDSFVERAPAQVNVAGDAGEPLTYAVLASLRGAAPAEEGSVLTLRVDGQGQVSDDQGLAQYGVTAATHVAATNHAVAAPFWSFMTSSGPVWDGGQIITGPLFADPYYATGLPITEAYWAEVRVGGTARLVLVQCFERRCLTYTPDNPDGWQVEAGNVGRHYFQWRYGGSEATSLAGQLAQDLKLAASDEAREAVLMEVFNRLHLGVYTTDGVQLLGGIEQGPNDLYFYDFEVAMAAAALGRGQTWGLHDLSLSLESAGVLTDGGQPIPVEILREALVETVILAQTDPEADSSFLPLLLYELGMRAARPYDLSAAPELESIRLDALGFLLLLTEISYGLAVDEAPFVGAGSDLPDTTSGIVTRRPPSLQQTVGKNCAFVGKESKESYSKSWDLFLNALTQKVALALRVADASLDAIHGMMLAYSVRVSELDDALSTHYGPAGHEPGAGAPLHFRVKVEMLDDLGTLLAQCGWLAGIEFPEKGPIPDVKMAWMNSGNLESHGTFECGAGCQKTGPDGIATLTFIPKDEARPGEGWQVEETGVVSGIALYQSTFSNNIGRVNEWVTSKSGVTRWFVTRHETPGYRITMTLTYDVSETHWLASDGDVVQYTAAGTRAQQLDLYLNEFVDGKGEFATVLLSGSGAYGLEILDPDHATVGSPACDGGICDTCGGTWTWSGTGTTYWTLDAADPHAVTGTVAPTGADLTHSPPNCPVSLDRGLALNNHVLAVDLDMQGTQTVHVPLEEVLGCHAGEHSGIRCAGSITWEIEVESIGPRAPSSVNP